MTKTEKTKLYNFCLNILAHRENDDAVTLCGNGINSAEAYWLIKALMIEMNIVITEEEIEQKCKELESRYS